MAMDRRRVVSILLMALLLATVGSRSSHAAQEVLATPPSYWPEGIASVTLANTGPGRPGENSSLIVQRMTYQPGSTYQFVRPYPVLLYIESGTLFFGMDGDHLSIGLTQDSSSGNTAGVTMPSGTAGGELVAGFSVYSRTGNIGTTRNDGTEPAVLTIFGIVPQHGGIECSSSESSSSFGTPVSVEAPEECHAT